MKSIMEEGSSIFKAVENAWTKAGKPKEFTIKIYEEPKKNFFGLTTANAKVGIFFSEAPQKQAEPVRQRLQTAQPAQARPQRAQPQPRMTREQQQQKEQPRAAARPAPVKEAPQREPQKYTQPVWTPQMIEHVGQWLKESLELMQKPGIPFKIDPNHFYLRIQFDKPIFEEKSREKQLFSSYATLILQMLKHQYRRPLKGYKIVLIGAE